MMYCFELIFYIVKFYMPTFYLLFFFFFFIDFVRYRFNTVLKHVLFIRIIIYGEFLTPGYIIFLFNLQNTCQLGTQFGNTSDDGGHYPSQL